MHSFKKVLDLQHFLNRRRREGHRIGFVPTMGALHEGHLSLIRQSKLENECTVCSIFVNPTQFNEASDLEKYPRTSAADIKLLTSIGTDVVFMPGPDEIYPPDLDTIVNVDFSHLDQQMEGVFRPGHFEGVAQVVKRLLDIVQAQRLYMGQKDFQQLSIIRYMIKILDLPTQLVACPIIREADGLAMSSRNRRLSPQMRAIGPKIHQSLLWAKETLDKYRPAQISQKAMELLSEAGFRPEYFDIVDGIHLNKIEQFEDSDYVVACLAAWAGEVRLIDNMILKQGAKAGLSRTNRL
ncbi:MAG: pantoate--beta-alanine ligase [Bacteroidota bacterium]